MGIFDFNRDGKMSIFERAAGLGLLCFALSVAVCVLLFVVLHIIDGDLNNLTGAVEVYSMASVFYIDLLSIDSYNIN